VSTHHLGRKFTCYSCHTKFYDLGKTTPVCPKCGADQRDAEEKPVASSHRSKRVIEQPPESDFDVEEEEIGVPESPVEEEELEPVEATPVEAEPEEADEEEEEEF
jgi:hypothetical protein